MGRVAYALLTDAGLRHLRELPYLQNIESDGTAITGQGVE